LSTTPSETGNKVSTPEQTTQCPGGTYQRRQHSPERRGKSVPGRLEVKEVTEKVEMVVRGGTREEKLSNPLHSVPNKLAPRNPERWRSHREKSRGSLSFWCPF
jgi:hypothetical protein